MRRPSGAAGAANATTLATTLAIAALAVWAGAGCAIRVPRSIPVNFAGPAGVISGSLFLPDGPGPHAGVVLVHGPSRYSFTDYPEEARAFATRGIAALAYDKRGTGGSDGSLDRATFEQLALDAAAAARYLRSRPEIDSTRVGLCGLGQGGWIAPLAATLDSTVAFVVAVSGPTLSPLELMTYQRSQVLVRRGMRAGEVMSLLRLRERLWEYWLAPRNAGRAAGDSLRLAFESKRREPWFAPAVEARDLPEALPPDEGMGRVNHPARWWLAGNMPAFWSLRYDPGPILSRVRAPLLAVYGGKDRDIPVQECVRRLRAAMERDGARLDVRVFDDADHDLRQAGPQAIFPRPAFVLGYRDTVVAWIARRVGLPDSTGAPARPAAHLIGPPAPPGHSTR